jgi:manganese/iron transport system permease protein
MLDPLTLPFMQRAALEIVLLAPLAGILGAQIVLRRLAFFTHGVGAAAFPGLVIAGPAGIPPALAAAAAGGGFAALLQRLTGRGVARDAATGLLVAAALAIGVILASDVFETGAGVDQLLFGSLLAIGGSELLVAAAALGLVAVVAARFRRAWIVAGFDEDDEGSPAAGAGPADLALLAAVAIAAIAAIDAVGALLVGAILVVPAATARPFTASVAELELGTALLALAEGLAGLLIAYRLDAPPGAVVAVLGGAVFVLALLWRRLRDRRPRHERREVAR